MDWFKVFLTPYLFVFVRRYVLRASSLFKDVDGGRPVVSRKSIAIFEMACLVHPSSRPASSMDIPAVSG